jgi:hypothetical protein
MYGMWPWVATFSKPPFGGARMKNKFKMKIKDKIGPPLSSLIFIFKDSTLLVFTKMIEAINGKIIVKLKRVI